MSVYLKGRRGGEKITFRPFKDLGRILRERGQKPSSAVQTKNEAAVDDDALFREAMRDVREIQDFRQMEASRRAPVAIRMRRDDEALKALTEITSGRRPISIEMTQEFVEWRNPAYSVRTVLCEGRDRIAVQDTLDLHGMNVDEAFSAMLDFLRDAVQRRRGCVKIIHGRGLRSPRGPVLKRHMMTWLTRNFRRSVISVMTARSCDGGLGAVYVRLRTDISL